MVKTVVLGPRPEPLEVLIQRRRALGLDTFDETYAKFPFYAGHGVDELIVADPSERRVRCYRLRGDVYEEVDASELLGVRARGLTTSIDWP